MEPPDPFAFYAALPRRARFADLADPGAYAALPDDWCVGLADIAGSTQAVAAGRYKEVNMVGAAVISAQINAHRGHDFPFVFGGDGAAFAVPPAARAVAGAALAATRVWAADAFGLTLRVAMIEVARIRAAGHDVAVARYAPTPNVDYAMITGGGIAWAEGRMKAGTGTLPEAPPGSRPDLTGLSCRWSHAPARRGHILSIVILPDAAPGFDALTADILTLVRSLDRGGHPFPPEGPGAGWPPAGARLEAHAMPPATPLKSRRRRVLVETLVARILLSTGIRLGGFDMRHYQRTVGQNADFRKFDDGLKMTLDCDEGTEQALRDRLDSARAAGIARYGIRRQTAAMMTCIVPSALRDDHVHFVDGADGGYTAAAAAMTGKG